MKLLGIVLCAGLLQVAGCTPGAQQDSRLQVVTSVYPIEEAARRIGADRVEVINLTPPGVEPHDLELRASHVRRIRNADLVLYIGAGFQPAIEDAVKALPNHDRAIDILEGLPVLASGDEEHDAEEEDGDEHGADPHVWLAPQVFERVTSRIAEAMARAVPTHSLEFEERAGSVSSELRALDDDYRAKLTNCDRREIFTSHASFAYLAREYGLKEIALTGLSPEAEPSPRKLQEVAQLARESGATTIFFETLVSPRVAETVARTVGATTAVLDPIEGLNDDQITSGQDYFSLMGSNLQALTEALGCR